MLPALTTKPKQAARQVKGLTNDSIDSYSNTPLGGGSGIGGGVAATYVDNTESGSGTARGSPPTTSRSAGNSARTAIPKSDGAIMARVVRDRKASGEEELSLRTGDVVKVLSTKRTGYLKCEAGDEVGYVPSSYLEFLDSGTEADNVNGKGNAADEEAQRAAEKQRRKQKKEKRKKEKREANDASEPEETAPLTARSPRKEGAHAEDDGNESPRKSSRKKSKKHRQDREAADEGQRGGASGVEEPASSARSRTVPEETERSRSKSKHSKKKRHRDVDSSESSESDGGKRSGRHGRRRRHRRGSSDSDSESTSSDDSDASYRRRRRRRRHRHRRSSSEEEDDDDSDYKRRSRRSKKRRDKNDNDSEPEEGSRSARKAEKKKLAATLQEVEKGVSQLDVKSDEKSEVKAATIKKEEPDKDRDRGKKEETERSEGSSEGRATNVSSSRKDDEGRTSSSTSKQNGGKSTLGKQIGEKMRSFLGGGSKKQHSSKNSSGILNACPGTVQGEEGWYEHGENERYYFILVDGKWSLLYGPMTEDDFEVFSNRVSAIEIDLHPKLGLIRHFFAGVGAKSLHRAAANIFAQVRLLSQPRAACAEGAVISVQLPLLLFIKIYDENKSIFIEISIHDPFIMKCA
ncbi:unnamed protein product [Phytophthora fragariaefolia]|uniref:Unnamed protein product n=1 Tax=Phytophthora fragariaefolia TaxID=1490495 RepID=A0A9W6X9M2_9STRA|nr:unnamed protein product [Phytophthora fragariaefolia]